MPLFTAGGVTFETALPAFEATPLTCPPASPRAARTFGGSSCRRSAFFAQCRYSSAHRRSS